MGFHSPRNTTPYTGLDCHSILQPLNSKVSHPTPTFSGFSCGKEVFYCFAQF